MPSGNKPLPELMLTKISNANVASQGHNELSGLGLDTMMITLNMQF